MKSATLPPLRVDSSLRETAESVLKEGETLSSFVLESVRLNIQRREIQREFVQRGLRARDEAKAAGKYVRAKDMLARLDATLARTRVKRTAKAK